MDTQPQEMDMLIVVWVVVVLIKFISVRPMGLYDGEPLEDPSQTRGEHFPLPQRVDINFLRPTFESSYQRLWEFPVMAKLFAPSCMGKAIDDAADPKLLHRPVQQ